jgi:L-fuculose-phosphate aldolase
MSDQPQTAQAIIATCLRCVELGYFVGTWGNVSTRCGDALLITPTRLDYDVMTPDDLVLVALDSGARVRGERLPSSEMQLHRALYLARPDISAIVHSHSQYASAVSCMHRGIPIMLEDMAQLIGEVHCAPYAPGERHLELAAGAVKHIRQASAVLLANHGPVCCGRDLREALVVNQVLEKSAQAFLWASMAGGTVLPIPAEHAAAERHRYLYKYGKAADVGQE